ncbi:collagen alpha-1(I) chain-like [Balaenoptera ricei]|uniref:collagen alpha-1(I) chain-like n=1 Tax=Balaenoptera ricei TaxID=2746895 RepID=UPI0028BEE72F|nr:collagen alpha-1(I) chain-like [Balaenoptera ricei]
MPPSFGKTLRVNRDGPRVMGPPGSAGPCAPASGSRSEQEPAPRRPANPPSAPRWLLGPPGGARAAGPTRPPAPPPPRPPAPRSRASDPAAGREALLGAGARPARAASRPSGPSKPPLHLHRGPRAALGAASSPGDRTRPAAGRRHGVAADPRVYPQLPTRSPPRSLSVQPLPPGCHRAPGPRRRLPTCGRATERGLQPLRGALGAHSPPPALRPAEAGGQARVAPGGKQGWVLCGSPAPTHFRRRPQQGGDRGAGAASAGGPSRRNAGPARRARGRHRPP